MKRSRNRFKEERGGGEYRERERKPNVPKLNAVFGCEVGKKTNSNKLLEETPFYSSVRNRTPNTCSVITIFPVEGMLDDFLAKLQILTF